MLDNFNQPKGSTIGVLKDGRTVQAVFDELHGSLTIADLRYMAFIEVGRTGDVHRLPLRNHTSVLYGSDTYTHSGNRNDSNRDHSGTY